MSHVLKEQCAIQNCPYWYWTTGRVLFPAAAGSPVFTIRIHGCGIFSTAATIGIGTRTGVRRYYAPNGPFLNKTK